MKKVAVVTGGLRGIGRAVVEELVNEGYGVAVNYFSSGQLLVTLPDKLKAECVFIQADLSQPEGRAKVADETLARFGRIDCLVNNAGLRQTSKLKDMTEEEFARGLNLNLTAAVFLTKAFLPYFRKGGSIVFVSSIVANIGSDKGLDYVAAKMGIQGAVRSLALELAPDLRVNAVAPGYIDTDLLSYDTPEKRQERIRKTPLRRIGKPEDVARTVAFLAGDKASFITGQTLHVNGGLFFS